MCLDRFVVDILYVSLAKEELQMNMEAALWTPPGAVEPRRLWVIVRRRRRIPSLCCHIYYRDAVALVVRDGLQAPEYHFCSVFIHFLSKNRAEAAGL